MPTWTASLLRVVKRWYRSACGLSRSMRCISPAVRLGCACWPNGLRLTTRPPDAVRGDRFAPAATGLGPHAQRLSEALTVGSGPLSAGGADPAGVDPRLARQARRDRDHVPRSPPVRPLRPGHVASSIDEATRLSTAVSRSPAAPASDLPAVRRRLPGRPSRCMNSVASGSSNWLASRCISAGNSSVASAKPATQGEHGVGGRPPHRAFRRPRVKPLAVDDGPGSARGGGAGPA